MYKSKSYRYVRGIAMIAMALIGLFFLNYGSKQINAKTEESPVAEFGFLGDIYGKTGNLRYGLTPYRYNPNVELEVSPSIIISHIYKNGDGGTTSPFALGYKEKDNQVQHVNFEFMLQNPPVSNGLPVDLQYKTNSSTVTNELSSSGITNVSGDDVSVELTLSPSKNKKTVQHEFTVTNNSDQELRMFPTKQVDTELANNDRVPIYSRGPKEGLYIKSGSGNSEYRLDYITNVENGPVAYQGGYWRAAWDTIFGSAYSQDFLPTVYNTIGKAKDEIVYKDNDTAIFLTWGTVVLAPGEKWTGRYNVGINSTAAPALKMKKEAENTNGATINKVGDTIQYKIHSDYTSNENEVLTDAKLVDKLPADLEKPTSVKVKNPSNQLEELNVDDVYNEQEHTLTVALDNANSGDSYELIYDTKIKRSGAGKVLKNTATISGNTPQYPDNEESVTHELEVDETVLGNVSILYEDSSGNQLAPPKELEGELGTSYSEEPISIDDWIYYQTEGNAEGEFSETPQTVKFKYMRLSEAFSLKQTVRDSSGNSVDGNTVKQGGTVQYKLELSLNEAITQEVSHLLALTLQDPVDNNLENPTDLTIKDSANGTIGEVSYDESSRKVIGRLTQERLESNKKVYIEYKAKVKTTAAVGTVISTRGNSTNLSVQTTSGAKAIPDIESNQVDVTIVAGLLEFVSAPEVLDFGQNHQLSARDKVYGVDTIEGDGLVVQDNRGVGNRWQMGVNVKTDLTSEDEVDTLMNAFHYQKDGQTIALGADSKIIRDETTQNEAPVILSDEWSENNGVQLHIRSGAAKAKQYKGSLQWTLRDVPL